MKQLFVIASLLICSPVFASASWESSHLERIEKTYDIHNIVKKDLGGRPAQIKFVGTDAKGQEWVIKFPAEINPEYKDSFHKYSFFKFEYMALDYLYNKSGLYKTRPLRVELESKARIILKEMVPNSKSIRDLEAAGQLTDELKGSLEDFKKRMWNAGFLITDLHDGNIVYTEEAAWENWYVIDAGAMIIVPEAWDKANVRDFYESADVKNYYRDFGSAIGVVFKGLMDKLASDGRRALQELKDDEETNAKVAEIQRAAKQAEEHLKKIGQNLFRKKW